MFNLFIRFVFVDDGAALLLLFGLRDLYDVSCQR